MADEQLIESLRDAPRELSLYDRGRNVQVHGLNTLAAVLDWLADDPQRLGIVSYNDPSLAQIGRIAHVMNLHPLLAEDLQEGHQRPKLERHGNVLFMVLHPAFYIDRIEDVAFAEAHIIKADNCVVVINHHTKENVSWTPRLPHAVELLQHGAESVLYSILDGVVDQTFPVLRGVKFDIEQIERQVFGGDSTAPMRIYRLSREVIDLQHATTPLTQMVEDLRAGFTKHHVAPELQAYLADVDDHLRRIRTQIIEIREVLTQILTVNAALVDQRSNEDMKTVSSWGAILLVPTLIGSIYGMNFQYMPELHWQYGYPLTLALMAASGFILWLVFKRRNWL